MKREWVALKNRFRTGHGKTGHMLHKWGLRPTSGCNCGYEKQTVIHITDDCNTRRHKEECKSYTEPQHKQCNN